MFDLSPTSIALLVGLVLTVGANVVQYLTKRQGAPEQAANTVWIGTQAADKIIENLSEQYTTAMDEMKSVREEVGSLRTLVEQQDETIGKLRTEVARLRRRIAAFEKVVKSLPTEIQIRFAEVMNGTE